MSIRLQRATALFVAGFVLGAALGTPVRGGGITPGPLLDAAPLPAGVTPVSGNLTFHGRGYGHGVGLSQYGARGRALAGQRAGEILVHYYAGVSGATIDPATPVRVKLLAGWRASKTLPLSVIGRGGAWTIDGVPAQFPASARATLTPSSSTATGRLVVTWRLQVRAADGVLLHDSARSSSFALRAGAADGSFELGPKPAGRNRYRGVLRIWPRTDGLTVSVANELGLDTYLRGVVPVEMPHTWPTEALRAQAVVARSYAARALRPGTSWWDVHDDTRSQVYHGQLGERATTDAAIVATAGRVLKSGTAIANTVFHSTAGGHTEHNENVFVSSSGSRVASPVRYLRGVPDIAPNGTSYDAGAPYARWTSGTWSVASISGWLAADARTNVGTLLGLDLRDRGVSGRLVSVGLYGSTGVKRVSADVFRSVINARRPSADVPIRSNLFALAPLP